MAIPANSRSNYLFVLVFISLLCNNNAVAQTKHCNALTPTQKQIQNEIFLKLHPYAGCDETFESCLAHQKPNRGVIRVADDLCRHIAAGKTQQEIKMAFNKRAQSVLPAIKPAVITLNENTLAGDKSAPVTVVVYACARCPFCKVVITSLYHKISNGVLFGKARLYFRPFPIKSHPGATEGGLAMVSAARLNRFWPFTIKLYDRYEQFCPAQLSSWASEEGLDKTIFEKYLADPQTRQSLITSKQEGLRNKVDATPTLFIDNVKYVYELQHDAIVDVLLEVYEAKTEARRQ
ncbi:MAG: thioredoxin domain-containing protein [Deltaproteobacteria bacterium]|nr:thioredoxin domain-containing protein [Deltaproteobacteria bacterium]